MTAPRLVDSHCHLDFPQLSDELPEVVRRAHDAGVTRRGTSLTRWGNEPPARACA